MKKKTKTKEKPSVKQTKSKKTKHNISKFVLTMIIIGVVAILGGVGFLVWYLNLEYTITFVNAEGVVYSLSDTTVKNGKSFTFEVNFESGITHYANLGGIMANGIELTGNANVYSIQNIHSNITIEAYGYGTPGLLITRKTLTQGVNTDTVVVPYGVTDIAMGAFSNYTSLKTVYIPATVETIYEGAFYSSGLTNLNMPDTAVSIKMVAFEQTPWLLAQPNGIVYAGKVAYSYKGNMPSYTNLTFNDDTKAIAYQAFIGQTNLISVVIPESVEKIGWAAFMGCQNLTSVTIGDHLKSLAELVFESTAWLNAQPDGLVYLNNWLYKYKNNPSTTSVTIREGTVGIGGGAFASVPTITNIVLPTSLKYISQNAFANTILPSIILPENLLVIENNAFNNCAITSITIPASVTKIGAQAFTCCYSLTQVVIYANLERLNDMTFNVCPALNSVTIFGHISVVHSNVFDNCIGLTNLTIYDTNFITILGDNFLSFAPENLIISVPSSLLTTYQSAAGWSAFASKIVAI